MIRAVCARAAMIEAAMTHLKYDTSITRAYHRITEIRGTKTAQVAAARRLPMCCTPCSSIDDDRTGHSHSQSCKELLVKALPPPWALARVRVLRCGCHCAPVVGG